MTNGDALATGCAGENITNRKKDEFTKKLGYTGPNDAVGCLVNAPEIRRYFNSF